MSSETTGVTIRETNRILVIPDMSEATGGKSTMFWAGGMYRTVGEIQEIGWEREYVLSASDELVKAIRGGSR